MLNNLEMTQKTKERCFKRFLRCSQCILLVLELLHINHTYGNALSRCTPACSSIFIQYKLAAAIAQKSLTFLLLHHLAFISASLEPLRIARGQLNISAYYSTSISSEATSKVKLPNKQMTNDLGPGHDYCLTTSAFQIMFFFLLGYFYWFTLQKSFTIKSGLLLSQNITGPCPKNLNTKKKSSR